METAKRSGKGCLIAIGIAILVAMLAGLLMIGGCVWMVKSAAGGGGGPSTGRLLTWLSLVAGLYVAFR